MLWPYKWGIPWASNPFTQSWEVFFQKRHRFFFRLLIPAIQIPRNPAGCHREGRLTPYVWFRPHCSKNGNVPGWRGVNLKANSEKIWTWTFASLKVEGSKFPEIAKEHGDLMSWKCTVSCFETKTCWAVTFIKDTLHSAWNTGVGRRSFPFWEGLLAGASVDGRNPAKTHLGCIKPCKYSNGINYQSNPINWLEGFLPSTVSPKKEPFQ